MVLDILEDYQVPLKLLDKIIDQSDQQIIALKQVSAGEQYFQGHFPGNPVMPGVLIVQAMVEAVHIFKRDKELNLSKIKKVKFRKMVKPGDSLTIKVMLKDPKKMIFAGYALLDEKVACSAELEFLD